MTTSPFHAGELAVQARAHLGEEAARVGRIIRAELSRNVAAFLMAQPFALLAFLDEDERPRMRWIERLDGVHVLEPIDAQHVRIRADLLKLGVHAGDPIGLLAIDLETRTRVRVNGTIAEFDGDEARVQLAQVYVNCPKYIQERTPIEGSPVPDSRLTLSERIARADTFFIATGTRAVGMDASHRGGRPGFIRQTSPNTLLIPDYVGNGMFNTLGNLEVSPSVALLFVDFERGDATELLGTARVLWNDAQQAEFPGAERLIAFEWETVVDHPKESALHWKLESYSPFDPAPIAAP